MDRNFKLMYFPCINNKKDVSSVDKIVDLNLGIVLSKQILELLPLTYILGVRRKKHALVPSIYFQNKGGGG